MFLLLRYFLLDTVGKLVIVYAVMYYDVKYICLTQAETSENGSIGLSLSEKTENSVRR
jgi:hypothetical protein